MVQRLGEKNEIYTLYGDRRIFDVADAVFQVFDTVFESKASSVFDHFFGVVYSNHMLGVFGKQLG